MAEVLVEGVRVHFDGPSGGFWLEQDELSTLAEHHHAHIQQVESVVTPSARACPHDQTRLLEHEFGNHSGIKVDECPQCGGLWLDSGELRKVILYLEANAEVMKHIPHTQAHEHIGLNRRAMLLLYQLVKRPPLY
jgi:Zn-finger nucleic acid-binding protein